MRHYFKIALFLFLVTASVTLAQTTENFVKTYKARTPTTSVTSVTGGTSSQSYKNFTYLDGLGRPMQTVGKASTIGGKDLITPIEYDDFGRQQKEYLPYYETGGTQDGSFRTNADSIHTIRTSTIYGDSYGYSQIDFEPSPLNRVNKQAAPGASWHLGTGKEIKFDRRTNTVADSVRIWTLDSNGLPITNSSYAANSLWVEINYDEDDIQTVQFTDKLGRVILKKTEGCVTPVTDGHSGWLSTYYVYDDLGQLRVVIPPLAIDLFEVNDVWAMSNDPDLAFEQYFRYTYDGRGRMTEKKVPGKDAEYILYDAQDRPVGMQDGVLRTSSKWLYSRYDALGRVLSTGLVTKSSQSLETLQGILNTAGPNNASLVNGVVTNGWPNEEGELLTVNYYDSYTNLSAYSYQANTGFDAQASTRVHGLQTGMKVKNLESGEYYISAIFYDDKGRVIQSLSDHQKGGTIRTSTNYNFENQPISSLTSSTNTGVDDILRVYSYNVIGQLAFIDHTVDGTTRRIVQNTYNDLGQLIEKSFPEISFGNQTYTYNIRGWLKNLGSLLPNGYTQVNYYQESGAATPRYNGNISRIDWGGKEGSEGAYKTRTYEYIYDHANRLKTANFNASSELNRFTVSGITYDANGNIHSLKRNNQRALSDYEQVDDLEYSYFNYGNRLSQVKDNNATLTYTAKDFKDQGTTEYGYDANGNMTSNEDKQITTIAYNHLNLPKEIALTSGAKIHFAYDATGNKLSQTVYDASGNITKTQDYIGEIVLLDGALDYLIHEEGRFVAEADTLWSEFYVKDHLGNVRQVLRSPISQVYIATMENGRAASEEKAFSMVSESRQTEPAHNVTVGGNQVAWLNANRGRMVGPGRTQEIYAGDNLKLQVHGKYLEDKNQKANAASFMAAGGKDRLVADLNELALSNQRAGGANPIALLNLADILAKDLQKKEAPEAYLMYALYDQDSNRYEVGKKVLTKNAANQHEILEEEMYISKDGYMETFVVNETSEDVWFDNMMVMSVSSVIVQETHYDPWGLELKGLGYQYGGLNENKYLYNGKELLDDQSLGLYDYGARYYDPVIGRWTSPDPMAESYQAFSPYNYTLNNPIAFTDPNGMWVEGQNGGMFTDDPDDISKFFQAVGNFFHNLLIPSPTQEGNEKQQATWATVGRVSETLNDLHDAQKDVLELAPGGFLGSALMDTQTGNFSGEEFAQNIAYEAGSGFVFGKIIGRAAMGVLKPLGLGSTGRIAAANLTEQLAMEEIISNPSSGKVLIQTMKDASGRWSGWSKMSNRTAHGVEIHYNALWENGVLKAIDDFKFK
jgi:RHS repeat-associated protein